MRAALISGALALVAASSIVLMAGHTSASGGAIGPNGRRCFAVAGDPGDAAIVNLTPVLAQGAGDGLLISSDVTNPPAAANVNFRVGSIDPNVAVTSIGTDGKVCFENSKHTSVHLVADQLGAIDQAVYTPASPSGAPQRLLDTRKVGGVIGPNGRRCFAVAGDPGDAAIVNLTPVLAGASGDGLVVPSDVANPPVAANVNYGVGSVDPNVAMVPIGSDGRVCFENSKHTSFHLVVDQLGTIDQSAYTPATASGAPQRLLDTRKVGGMIGPNGRRCFAVAGDPGDAAVVNLTPVLAQASGDGLLVASDVTNRPVAASVNFAVGSVDPNVAVTPIGADGRVCFENSKHTNVHLVADQLGTIDQIVYSPATASGAPKRVADTRRNTGGTDGLLGMLVVAPQNSTVVYDRDDWPHWIDADDDCQDTRAEVLIRESRTSVTFADASACRVLTGSWTDPWTGLSFAQASDVDIDHTVALANAHRSGGWAWTLSQKRVFANDIGNLDALRPMDDGTNVAKSDRGPETWKPPVEEAWCGYATDWATIKIRWELTVTVSEYDALQYMLETCDTPPPAPSTTSTTTTTTTVPEGECDLAYPTVCVPPPPPDLDCADIPYRNFTVLPPDPHNFDGNNDGIACQT